MKKIFTFFAVALLAISANAQTAKVAGPEEIVVLADDESPTEVVLTCDNDFETVAWSFNSYAPEGVQIDSGELTGDLYNNKRGKYTGTVITTARTDGGTIWAYADAAETTYKMPAQPGDLLKWTIYTNSKFPEGSEGVIELKEIAFGINDKDKATAEDVQIKVRSVSAEEYTAIKGISMDNLKNAEIFNMSGQRVANATKGLYIINGKKVILK